ncbi:MAG TPA: hypothetical protein ENK97_00560 [Campylobacteraceae bacterium]|nr:hypothetical protein [Campylobacteraceae bacterium]
MNLRLIIALLIVVDFLLLLYGASTLSISYDEAVIYYDQHNFLHYLVKLSTALFGQNDIALRLPFMLFHAASIVLLWHVSHFFLKKPSDRLLSVVTFMLLPGVVSSALLVNSASIAIFLTLLFVWLYMQGYRLAYMLLLPLLLFVDNSFMVLYLGVFSFAVYRHDRILALYTGTLFLLALGIYGFPMHGKPRGYIMDTLVSYSLIFSPLVFLYFFYTLYRILMKEEKNIVWFISFIALLFSILISYRQRILIDDFAPYVVVSVPLMVRMFMTSYRVRLPELRRGHKALFITVFTILFANFLLTYTYKYLYLFTDKPSRHFAYKYNIAKELAQQLREMGITEITTGNKLQKRLRFYGILPSAEVTLRSKPLSSTDSEVTISYINRPIKTYYVSKVNN